MNKNPTLPFTKMHGCGNDYVYLDALRDEAVPTTTQPLVELARTMSDRHTGIGADGLIVLAPSIKADVRMRMFNADGSESEMCGNGIRCLAKLAFDHAHVRGPQVWVETGAGVLEVTLHRDGKRCTGATVAMGRPRLIPDEVPVEHPGPGPRLALTIPVKGERLRLLAVGMGNPHAVCFVEDPEQFPVAKLGPLVETHTRFPRRTNVEFVARLPDEEGVPVLRQRTWERGSGETQACGTGACATVVAAILSGVIPGRAAVVRLNGGDLHVTWEHEDAEVVMSGPAVTVFEGKWPVASRS
jgi:diaminopimelate epimerase